MKLKINRYVALTAIINAQSKYPAQMAKHITHAKIFRR